MIRFIIKSIPQMMRVAVTTTLLSVVVFLRYRMGTDNYAPWTRKPHGTGEGMNNPSLFWFVGSFVLTFLYIRVFMAISIANYSNGFDVSQSAEITGWLSSPLTLWIYDNPAYAPGDGSSFFFWLGYAFIFAMLIQFVHFLVMGKKTPDPDEPGKSVFLFWIRDLKVLELTEAVLLGLVALGFWWYGWNVHAVFFAIPAFLLLAVFIYKIGKAKQKEQGDDVERRHSNQRKNSDSDNDLDDDMGFVVA